MTRANITIRDVARKAGVSVNTVSRALNGTNREVWPCIARRADEIRRLAQRMGYRPNAAARAMRTAKSRHLGLIMSGSHAAPFEYPVIMGINARLQEAGYALSIVSSSETGSRTPNETPLLRERFLAGAFIMHVPDEVRAQAESALPECIHVDSNVRTGQRCIYRDERHAGRLAASKMVELGYARLLFIGNKPWEGGHVFAVDRVRGVREAARKAGVDLDVLEVGFGADELAGAAEGVLRSLSRTTGVIVGGQALAEWLTHVANAEGFYPGRDFGLASCAETPQCAVTWPGLSRVSFDRVDLGRRAAAMMLSLVEDGAKRCASVPLRGEWIAGETARRRKGGRR